MADTSTANADLAVSIDRVLAAHFAGDNKLGDADLAAAFNQRRELREHFAAKKLCPTCGRALEWMANSTPAPMDANA